MLDLGSLTRIEPVSSAVEAWNPNHWTSKEFPGQLFLTIGPTAILASFICRLTAQPNFPHYNWEMIRDDVIYSQFN